MMNNMNFMQYTTDYISGVMSLRNPQEESLKILEDIINDTNLMNNENIEEILNIIHSKYPICTDFERKFISLTFALATGVGKTRLMGAFITYLYTNYGIKNFLVVAPGTTIYEKLKADLGNPDNPKYVFKGLGCFGNPPKVIANDDYANKNISLFDSEVNIYVYNIGKFDKDKTKMKAFNEFLGMSFYDKLAKMKDLVIIMDESHHYRADKGMMALNELKPVLGLELTATPIVNMKNKQVPFKNVVYEYPLSEAIKDGYTRVPFAVTRTDIDFYHFGDEQLDKLMLNDGIKCHEMIKNKLASYSKVNNKPLVKPFMLVVCKDTNHAKIIEEYIKSDEFRSGKYKHKTIKIESKMSGVETETNTKLLLEVEKVDNPVEIVIHVNMLKEGWDVNNLYTIVPLRTASSKILREQMVGRGLRLPYGERTGDKEIDSVMLTAHDKFQEILDEAQKGNSIFKLGNVIKVEEVEDEKFTYTQLALDLTEEQDELRGLLQVREDEEKYTFSNSINELVKDKVTEYVYNNKNKRTEESRNTIKKQIEEEIKNNEDLGRIFEENRNLIENWMNKAIEKAEKEYEKYKVADELYMEMPDIMKVTKFMMSYLRGNEKKLSIETEVEGNIQDFFNEKDRLHMADVQGLFLGGLAIRRGAIIVLLFSMAALVLMKADWKRLIPQMYQRVLAVFLALTAVAGFLFSRDFNKYFVIFHHIFFNNNLWILDPAEDYMIRMLPEGFFYDMVMRIGSIFAVFLIVSFVCSIVQKKINKRCDSR